MRRLRVGLLLRRQRRNRSCRFHLRDLTVRLDRALAIPVAPVAVAIAAVIRTRSAVLADLDAFHFATRDRIFDQALDRVDIFGFGAGREHEGKTAASRATGA